MKKKMNAGNCPREKLKLLERFLIVSLWGVLLSIPIKGFSQEKRFTFEYKHVSMSTVFLHIQKNSDYSFVYNPNEIQRIGLKDYKFENATIQEILDECLKGTKLKFKIRDRHIIIQLGQQVRESQDMMLVRGRVVGKDSIGLPGVTVMLKGSVWGVTTDQRGYYNMNIPEKDNPVLVFSFVGMRKQEIPCGKRSVVNVVMETEAKSMDEVVVTGYQTLRKRDVVGAVTTVRASDVMMPAYSSIDQMLQGRVAGMVVMNSSSRVGTNPKIRIRGTSTILGNQDPLWVVDGIIQPDPLPIDQSNLMVDDLKNILGNQISWLNPADINTITVLKDASATAIYGSKAANGVIVITTKRGVEGRLTVSYSGNFTFRARPNYGMFNMMNSRERIQFSREAFDAGAVYNNVPVASMDSYEGIMRLFYDKRIAKEEAETAIQRLENINTDWLKLLTQNSFSHSHNISMSGGSEKVTYNASLGYNDQAGIEMDNKSQLMSGRLNMGVQLHPKLLVDVSLMGSVNNNRGYAAEVNPMSYAINTSRAVPAFDENGDYFFQRQRANYPLNPNEEVLLGYNILNEMEHSYSKNKSTQLSGILNLAWNVLPWLKYEFVGGLNNNIGNGESYAGERTNYIAKRYRGYDFGTEANGSRLYKAAYLPYGGELVNTNTDVQSWNIQNKVSIYTTFKEDHRINLLLGTEVNSTTTKNRSNAIYGYVPERGEVIVRPTPMKDLVPLGRYVPALGIMENLYNGRGWSRQTQTANQFSVFATLAYVFKDRYVLNASMRNDASNRFGQDQNKRFDPAYSFGVSWDVMQEPWLHGISNVFNQLNLRASYGIQGNAVNSISPDIILSQGSMQPFYGAYASNLVRLPNPNLSWERTKSWNFGVDMQFLSWITMNLEYYTKKSNNIVSQDIAVENGRPDMEINGGRITNSGVEYSLNITPIRTKDWGWTIGLNSSKNWNKAKTKSIDDIRLGTYLSGASDRVLKEGYALSSFWSYSFRRLNPDTGYPEYNLMHQLDENGQVKVDSYGRPVPVECSEITDFLVWSGKTEPDFTGGLTTRLRWKGLTLGANLSLLLGAKKRLKSPFPAGNVIPSSETNVSRDLLRRWRKPGDVTDIPGIYTGRVRQNIPIPIGAAQDMYNMWNLSDARVVDASFLRCQQMSLGWNVNEAWCSRLGLKSVSLNLTMNNVFVIASKKFNGFDPELGNSIQPKTYTIGINVGF